MPQRSRRLDKYVSAGEAGEFAPNADRMANDGSLESLRLLRVLYGVCCHWIDLYVDDIAEWPASTQPLLAPDVFVSAKLAAKANRQLQDVLTIATQQVPQWLTELVDTW